MSSLETKSDTKLEIFDKQSHSSTEKDTTQFSYLPFLDGLRAFSILLVLGFHKLGPIFTFIGDKFNGWVGVELFFVISGFLITSILLKEKAKKGFFSLKNFYIRRWLRICPAYYFFIATMTLWALCNHKDCLSAFIMASLYLTNLDLAFSWGFCPPISGILHTWSLAVEEQFYLFWPVTLRICKNKAIFICSAIIIAVYFWRIYLLAQGASVLRLSTGLDTKIDSIIFGALSALLWQKESFKSFAVGFLGNNINQFLIFISLLVSCYFIGNPHSQNSTELYLLWTCNLPLTLALTSLLILSLLANQKTILASFLSSKPFVFIGKLSYSLYLWHVLVCFPQTNYIFEIACNHKKYVIELAKLISCIGLASLSYYVIEQPFLKLKNKFV